MQYPIHDLYVRSLETEQRGAGRALPIVRYSDHLLRRFGLAEIYRLPADHGRESLTRPVADELWALVRGRVRFEWHDHRPDSPTHGEQYRLECDRPTLVLVPFGVAFGFQALEEPVELVRLATHEEDEADG